MPSLPTGTVTLLFTDIKRSTHLLQRLGSRYGDVLAESCADVVKTSSSRTRSRSTTAARLTGTVGQQ